MDIWRDLAWWVCRSGWKELLHFPNLHVVERNRCSCGPRTRLLLLSYAGPVLCTSRHSHKAGARPDIKMWYPIFVSRGGKAQERYNPEAMMADSDQIKSLSSDMTHKIIIKQYQTSSTIIADLLLFLSSNHEHNVPCHFFLGCTPRAQLPAKAKA